MSRLIALVVLLWSASMMSAQSVELDWTQSTDGATSNKVYRSTTSGSGYTLLYASSSAIITWTDTTVSRGQTYYYVVTTVNTAFGTPESLYSNEVSAPIPSPGVKIEGNVKIQGSVTIQ